MMHRLSIIAAAAGMFLASAAAVEIPLERGTVFGAGTAGERTSIGYVDIEKAFAEHPMKKRLQDEFRAEVEKRKKEIAALDQSIADLEKVIVSSTTEINRAKLELDILRTQAAPAAAPARSPLSPGTTESIQAPGAEVAPSSAAVQRQSLPEINPAVIQGKEAALREKETGMESLRTELEKRKEEMARRIQQDKAELGQMEEKNTADVLADLYQILQKVATAEGVTIVIDKNDVLYGQSGRDLTDKVLERLQGR